MACTIRSSLARLSLIGLFGCSPPLPETATVTGKVTLDGKPMENLGVLFQPTQNSSLGKNTVFPSGGKTEAGKFSLEFINGSADGAVIGDHFVTISEPAPADDRDLSMKEELEQRKKKPLIPPKWANGNEKRTVEPGENEFHFELNEK